MIVVGSHRPAPRAKRHAEQLASRVGADIDLSRSAFGMTITDTARGAGISPSTVGRVIHGDSGVHLDTLCAIASSVGLRISIKAYPAEGPSLRDSGQLRIAEYLVSQAHPTLRPALELPVGDPFGRAADLVFFGPEEILHEEIERRLSDWQATWRAATVKRDALQSQHARPVRLVLAVEDTHRNRLLVEPHAELIRRMLPATSSEILRALRSGTPLGRDGLLWVRPWRASPDGGEPADVGRLRADS